jgi:hypothetical protein
MKIRKIIIIILGVLLVCVPAYFILMFWSFSNMKVTTSMSSDDLPRAVSDTFSGIDRQLSDIDVNLPHRIYQKTKDSLENIQQIRKTKNMVWPMSGGWNAENIGMYRMKKYPLWYYSDSVPLFDKDPPFDTAYYLGLSGYTLNSWDYEVYRENGKDYMKYVIWDTLVDNNGKKYAHGHHAIKDIPISVAEAPKNDNIGDINQKRTIYIPVTQKTYGILSVLFKVINIFLIIWSILCLFVLPVRVLQLIAKGEAFTKKTIRLLHIISFSLIGFYCYHVLSFYVVRLFVSNKIPAEFKYSSYELFTYGINYILAGIIVFAIAVAFKKGSKLQEEQELTV